MMVISLREFRGKQGFYMDQVRKGQDVVLKTRDNFSVRLQPIEPDDTLMTKEEFFEMLERGQAEFDRGETRSFKTKEELERFLDAL